MKQFEKWDKEQHNDLACKRMDNISCNDCTDLKREGWRAALEWTKTIASSYRKCGIKTEVEEIIEKELKGD